MLRAALEYARHGMYVFPLSVHGDVKAPSPMLGKTDGHRKATIDEAQITAWWTAQPNAGIGCWLSKSGLIAIDVDPRNGGDEQLAALEAQYGALDTPVVGLTGGGGRHLAYRAPPDASPPGLVHRQPGLDIKYNGYIVLPPSLHASKVRDESGKVSYVKSPNRYRWTKGGRPFDHDIPEIPEWVLRRDIPRPAVHHLNGHEVDVFAEDTPKVGLTDSQIRTVLSKIQNENARTYQDWLAVLQGVYHETDGSEDGRAAAYEWSSENFKHLDEEFHKTWQSLNIEGKGRAPTTFRFALKLAKEEMAAETAAALKSIRDTLALVTTREELTAVLRTIKTTEIPDIDRIGIAQQIQAAHKTIPGFPRLTIGEARNLTRYENPNIGESPKWLEGWWYCAEEAGFYHRQRGVLPRNAFDDLFNSEMLSLRDKLEGRAVPDISAANAALNRYEIPKVDGRRYMPEQPETFEINGARYLNTYSESEQPRVPDTLTAKDREAIRLVEAHFAHLIPDEHERETVLSWLAYITQSRKRPTWAVVLQSPEGEGKGFIVNLMAVILGASNVGLVDVAVIESTFNGWGEGDLLKSVDELKMHGHNRYDVLNKLKGLITNETVSIHRKNRDPYKAVNTAGYLITTNYRDALPITEQDSRYWLHASPRQTRAEVVAFEAANPGYFDRLFGVLKTCAGALRGWLLGYPIAPHFKPNGRAPASAEHDYVSQLNRSDDEDLLDDAIASGTIGLSGDLLSAITLKEWFEAKGARMPQTRALNSLLSYRGFHYLGRFRIDGSLDRFFSLTPAKFGTTDHQRSRRIRAWMTTEGL